MTLFIGGVADRQNIEVAQVNGRPIEEVRIAHAAQPMVRWTLEDEPPPPMPRIRADVYRFCDGEYRYWRTV